MYKNFIYGLLYYSLTDINDFFHPPRNKHVPTSSLPESGLRNAIYSPTIEALYTFLFCLYHSPTFAHLICLDLMVYVNRNKEKTSITWTIH